MALPLPIVRLLRWSERYTKTDMVYLATGGFWLTVGQGISSLSALILAVAFANLVPPETYGTYKYLLSIAALFSLFTLPGMNTAIARAVARGDTTTIRIAARMRVVWGLLGTATALIGSGYYFYNDNIELALAFALIGVLLPFFDTFTLYNSYFTGKRDFKTQTIFHLVAQGISTVSLVTVLFFSSNVVIILLAYFIPLTLVRFALHMRIAGSFTTGPADKQTLHYGKQLSLISVLGVIANNIDKILLWKFLGPAQLAVYTFALAIPEQLKGPMKGVGDLAFPKFAAQTSAQIRANMPALWGKLVLYALGLLCVSLVYILLAPVLFKILFPHYLESVPYSQLFALSLVTGVGSVLLSMLEAQKHIRAQYVFSTVQPLVAIILFLGLTPLYGVTGAILAYVISRFATVVLLAVIQFVVVR